MDPTKTGDYKKAYENLKPRYTKAVELLELARKGNDIDKALIEDCQKEIRTEKQRSFWSGLKIGLGSGAGGATVIGILLLILLL